MKILIKENIKMLKNKSKLINDYYFNTLINLFVDDSKYFKLLNIVRFLFYIQDETQYERELNLIRLNYFDNLEECKEIFQIFSSWKPYEKYQLSQCRGAFLEILTYELLVKKYGKNNVFLESNIQNEDFKSHTWDSILLLENQFNCYECKFTSHTIKRSHLNTMIGTNNKIENTHIFLVTLDIKLNLIKKLSKLQEDTKTEQYENMLKKIELITLEDFINRIPF